MTKYHINNAGVPSICRATTRPCPLGGEHFDTKEKAVEFAQQTSKESFGLLPGVDSNKSPLMTNTGIDENTLTYIGRFEAIREQILFAQGSYGLEEGEEARLEVEVGEIASIFENGYQMNEEETNAYISEVEKSIEGIDVIKAFGNAEKFRDFVNDYITTPHMYRSVKKAMARRDGENPDKYNNYLKTWSKVGGGLENFPPDINENETIVSAALEIKEKRLGVIDEQGEFVLPPVFSNITDGNWVRDNVKTGEFAEIAGDLQKGYYFASVKNGPETSDTVYFAVSEKTGKIAKINSEDNGGSWEINGQFLDKDSFYEDIENSSYSTLDLEGLMPKYEDEQSE